MVRVVFNQMGGHSSFQSECCGHSSFQSVLVVTVVFNQSVGGHSSLQSECWWS